MMYVTATLLLLAVAGGVSADGHRQARASAGSYSGVSNGQFYGGTFHTPDNGPTIFNRFGDEPSGSQGGSYGGAGPGAFAGAGSAAGAGYAPGFGFIPGGPPFQNPFEFNDFFQGYFRTLSNNLAARRAGPQQPLSVSSAHSALQLPGGPAPDRAFEKNLAYQRAAFNAAQKAFQTASTNRFGSAPEYQLYEFGPGGSGGAAGASASLGPHGGHQSAFIYPENSGSPNVNTRFGTPNTKPGGSFGVSSSSHSSSVNLNGKKTTHKQASTSINDNGKVTTFVVRD